MTLLKAPAKVNLFLHVVGKKFDGYHLIESLVVFCKDVYDEILIEKADENSLEVISGEFKNSLEGANLIYKALNFTDEKYSIKLTKNLPVAAGLGGGSSDVCAVIRHILNDQKMDENLISNLVKIGADVPLCYDKLPKFVRGVGEELLSVKNIPKLFLLLVNPQKTLLTKNIFSAYSKSYSNSLEHMPKDFKNDAQYFIDFIVNQGNDLSMAACSIMPEIKEILRLIKTQKGCSLSRMSGSGATCFGIFEDSRDAKMAYENIKAEKQNYWVKLSEV